MNNYNEVQALLTKEHRLEHQLGQLVYGAPEIRDDKYIYLHRREFGRQTTCYAGEYSDELYNLILRNNIEAKKIKKELKKIQRELRDLGFTKHDLNANIKRNLDMAKRNLVLTIHSQAILEGVATTFAETEAIIEGARVQGMTEKDVRKIINIKHAWEFILDDDVIMAPDNFALLAEINKLVEEGFYFNAGKLRDVPINIGGSSWRPELPVESKITEGLNDILSAKISNIDKAINLTLFIMRSQLFIDGNERTAVIFANHFLIRRGLGLLYIPENQTTQFKKLLVEFYETNKKTAIAKFLKNNCLLKI